ncbi:MAG TPA: nickel insertion protein, partial [Terriglobales bacterium]|nr:nickel insertion protein [Terriglobales bacterium]
MRIAYLDCFSGISGDMFLAALLDAGVSRGVLERAVAALKVDARLEVSRVNRSGISALKVDVYSHGE